MKHYLFDIEGTTTDINFVHKVLFPYSIERIESFIKENSSQLEDTLLQVEGKTLEEKIHVLKSYIQNDIKDPCLKKIQGLIWDRGYADGSFQGHVYSDVYECFKKWKSAGIELSIYSSGSVHAQKALFSHSVFGDLTPLLSFYFDTKVGHKKEVNSYQKIKEVLKSDDITFFSDVKAELDAAKFCDFKTFHVFRDRPFEESTHSCITSFVEVE